MYTDMRVENTIVIFDQEPEYHPDQTDVDIDYILRPKVKRSEGEGDAKLQVIGLSQDKAAKRDAVRRSRPEKRSLTAEVSNLSPHQEHSAEELCRSPYSHGPNFGTFHEQLFCDMHTRTLYPFCMDENAGETCYNVEANTLIKPASNQTVIAGAVILHEPVHQFKEQNIWS